MIQTNREQRDLCIQRISELKNMLMSQASEFGDWKFIKQFEASTQNLQLPYTDEEMQIYHTTRVSIRQEINSFEQQLEQLEKEME